MPTAEWIINWGIGFAELAARSQGQRPAHLLGPTPSGGKSLEERASIFIVLLAFAGHIFSVQLCAPNGVNVGVVVVRVSDGA